MLSTAEICDRVAQMTYRPGWTLSVYENGFEDPHLEILAVDVPNSYRPGSTLDLRISSSIPPMDSIEQLDRWVMWRLERVESHEAREWLQIDGRPLFDPHRLAD